MKNTYLLFLCCCLLGFCTCKNEELECEVYQVDSFYEDYQVDFFTTHKDFKIKDPVFETVTEQVLVKEAHLQGATFETVTEQVLVKAASSMLQILDSQYVHIVVNAETNTIAELVCYNFFDESNFILTDVPAQYQTRTIQRVLVPGTGAEVPPVFSTREFERLVSNTELIAVDTERVFNRLLFRIPSEMTIQEYLIDQFSQQSILSCEEGNSFRIVE
jgi:hypothetical protein